MSGKLPNERIAHILANVSGIGKADAVILAHEVQQWRALIPEVIEQLEEMRTDDAASIGISRMSPRFNAVIAKLREAIK